MNDQLQNQFDYLWPVRCLSCPGFGFPPKNSGQSRCLGSEKSAGSRGMLKFNEFEFLIETWHSTLSWTSDGCEVQTIMHVLIPHVQKVCLVKWHPKKTISPLFHPFFSGQASATYLGDAISIPNLANTYNAIESSNVCLLPSMVVNKQG